MLLSLPKAHFNNNIFQILLIKILSQHLAHDRSHISEITQYL